MKKAIALLLILVLLQGCVTFRFKYDPDLESAVKDAEAVLSVSVQLLELYKQSEGVDEAKITRLQGRIDRIRLYLRSLREVGIAKAGQPPWEDTSW